MPASTKLSVNFCSVMQKEASEVVRFFLTSPLGQLELRTCDRGVHGLQITGVRADDDFKPCTSQDVGLEPTSAQPGGEATVVVNTCIEWLNNFFHDKSAALTQPLPPICSLMHSDTKHSAPFTRAVWKSLAETVRYGCTVSYGELARQCGSAGASRAVGQAMRNNDVSLMIPCHRVISSDGKAGNYSGGKKNSVKVWLLRHEGASVKG